MSTRFPRFHIFKDSFFFSRGRAWLHRKRSNKLGADRHKTFQVSPFPAGEVNCASYVGLADNNRRSRAGMYLAGRPMHGRKRFRDIANLSDGWCTFTSSKHNEKVCSPR